MKTILRLLFLFPVVSSLAQPTVSNQAKGIPPVAVNSVQPAQTPAFDPDRYLRESQPPTTGSKSPVPVNAVQPVQAPAFDPSKPSQPVQPAGQVANAPKSPTTASIDFQPLTAADIARDAFPSVVLIATQDIRGQPLSLGSGFFVEKNLIATNFHVIEGAGAAFAKIISQPGKLTIKGIVGLDAAHDLALLQVDMPTVRPLAIAPATSASVGDTVYAIGNPRGLEGTFSQGIVSSVREFGSDRLLQITAPLSPGSSGGPVLNRNGAVIGVSVASITNGQNLNFAVPADYVKQLEAKKTELRPFRSIPQVKVSKTLLGQLGNAPAREGLEARNFTYGNGAFHFSASGEPQTAFSFSLRNTLSESVANVHALVIFYDLQGEPLDAVTIQYAAVIPAGLAKRVSSVVDKSVAQLNSPSAAETESRSPQGKVEFRILDFTVADE